MLSRYVMEKIGEQEREAVEKVKEKIDLLIREIRIEFVIIVLINMSVLLIIPLLFGLTNVSKIIISITIWTTLIYTFATLPYTSLYQFVFRYSMNFYQFLYAEVKKEVFEEYEKLNNLEKIVNKQFGKSKNHIVFSITEDAYDDVKKTLRLFIIVIIFAYVIYQYLREKLIEIYLHSSFFDLLLFSFF